ncbi:MAG: class I SAM-dependent methyltransferase [Candidatus Thorarchaeota archaeon]
MADPWSEIMMDAATGVAGEYTIERDDGRIETLQVLDYIRPLLEWPECERLAIQHATGKVLDIGCGAGRVLFNLQSLGHEVVGIDLARGAIEACRSRGITEVHVMSAGEMDFPDATFDTVVMFGNNFGILGSDDNIIDMLKTLHRITTPQGIILAGSADVVKTDDEEHLDYHKLNVSRNRPKGLIRLRVAYRGLVDEWMDLRLATPNEMVYLAEMAGWSLERKYQDGTPYVGILVKK